MTETSRPLLAALWMTGAIVSFSSMAIAGRALSHELDSFEMMMYRSFIGLFIVIVIGLIGIFLRRFRGEFPTVAIDPTRASHEQLGVSELPTFLHVDEEGIVWCGTWGGGLSSFDGETWKVYTVKDGLPANHIFMLGPERKGRLWVGTSHGLSRFDGEKFVTFTVHDGLYTNNLFSIIQ